MLIEISSFQNIEKLDLVNFNKDINYSYLTQLKSLKELTLNGSLTREQMNDVMKLSDLSYLSIKGGKVEMLELPPKLNTLSLNNVLIEDNTLQDTLPALTKLYLRDVYFVDRDETELLQRIEGVTELDIWYTKLNQVNFINQLKNLQILNLNHIGLTDITSIEINQLPKLKQIQFSEDIQISSETHIENMKKVILDR